MPARYPRRHVLASLAAVGSAGCATRLTRQRRPSDAQRQRPAWVTADGVDRLGVDLVRCAATPALADADRSLSVGDAYRVVVRHVAAPPPDGTDPYVGAAFVGPSPNYEAPQGEIWLNWGVAGLSTLAYAHELGHSLGYRHPEPGEHDSRLMRRNVDAGQVRDSAYDATLDPVTVDIAAALPWVDVYEWASDPAATLRPLVDRWREDRLADGDLDWALRRFDDAEGRDVWFGDPNPRLNVDREGETLALDGVGQFYRP